MNQDKLKLSITKPCSKIWEGMKPNEEGRFCNSCKKTVIDFTRMNDLEITEYFVQRNESSTCGRFYNTQLERVRIDLPTYILQKQMSSWKKYLLIVFICFGAQLFSVDINFGFNNLYAQTKYEQNRVKHNKYNQAKRKLKVKYNKRCNNQNIIIGDLSTTISLGVIRTTPENEIIQNAESKFKTRKEVSQVKNDSKINSVNYDVETRSKPKSPSKQNQSQNNFEFVLPPLISIRKLFKKVKSFNTSH